MAIKVTDLGGEVTLSATELLCSVAGISTLALKKDPHIFDIKTDYDPDNRIIYDIYGIVDASLYDFKKSVTDATGVLADFSVYSLEKVAADLVASVDEYLFTIDKSLADTGYATDALVALLYKVVADSVAPLDTAAWHATLDKIDAISAYDAFTKTVYFNRFFFDYVSIDDWSNIDKHYTGTKVNVAAITDYSASNFNKVLDDSAISLDANTIYTSKPFYEVTNLSDTFNKEVSFVRSFADFVAVDDFANIDKNYIGTKTNIASVEDYQNYNFAKGLVDYYTTVDNADIITAKLLTEVTTVLDTASVVKIGGDTSIFNASAFNQSTFG